MKTETSNKEKKYINNIQKPDTLDDFWKDCITQKEKKYINTSSNNSKINQKIQKLNIITENDNNSKNKKINTKTYFSAKLYEYKPKHLFNDILLFIFFISSFFISSKNEGCLL